MEFKTITSLSGILMMFIYLFFEVGEEIFLQYYLVLIRFVVLEFFFSLQFYD